jgi:hypothetical protein
VSGKRFVLRDELDLLGASPEPPPSVAFLPAVRPTGLGPSPAGLVVRLRLRVGAVLST